jgi:hypothetical protein
MTAYVIDPLNEQASVLVDAQTDIKLLIKNGVLSGTPFYVIAERGKQLINKAINRIRSPTLKIDAQRSLTEFLYRAYADFTTRLPVDVLKISAVLYLMRKMGDISSIKTIGGGIFKPKTTDEKRAFQTVYGGSFETRAKGVPLQEFQKDYIDKVSGALKELAENRALDPNDVTGRNSLRNLAEMQVRYERHLDDIQRLKENGNKLVICSTHGDCSERCARWQGRVYSLDGTSGTTKDGRKYVPLEVATDIYYTTKAGRTYQNGLLGFNCRHKLSPYVVGMVVPTVTEKERIKQDKITKMQRQMEREVIHAREVALMYKGVDAKKYNLARRAARIAFEEYKTFSKDNKRAYYPDRVKIL